ncbi:MAG: hypothetical protein AB7Q17_13745 [Phycisphaerae bacterium]
MNAESGPASDAPAALSATRAQLVASETRVADLEQALATMNHDYGLVMGALMQKIQETSRFGDAYRHWDQITDAVDDLHAERRERQADIDRLRREVETYRQRVEDLRKSRWRRIGLRLGVARRAAWENGDASA